MGMSRKGAIVIVTLVIATLVIHSASAPAQNVPVSGVTGTMGLDGTVDKFYAGTHSALVKTADGIRHLVHLTDRTAVHGRRPTEDPFSGLEEGSQVVVHYVVNGDTNTAVEIDRVGDGGLNLVEGTVVGIDRVAKKLTIQLADDSSMTLRLTDRAAHDVGKDVMNRAKVIVYYADEGGTRVAHYFKTVR